MTTKEKQQATASKPSQVLHSSQDLNKKAACRCADGMEEGVCWWKET